MQKLKLEITDRQAKKIANDLIQGLAIEDTCEFVQAILIDAWDCETTVLGGEYEITIESVIKNYISYVSQNSTFAQDAQEEVKTMLVSLDGDMYSRHTLYEVQSETNELNTVNSFMASKLISETQFLALKDMCKVTSINLRSAEDSEKEIIQVLVHPDNTFYSTLN